MNVDRIEQLKQAEINCKKIITLSMIGQKIAARTSGMKVLKSCIQKCKEIGDEAHVKDFYSKAVAMSEEIKQLCVQLDAI